MQRMLLASAMELMQRGTVPSVSDVAEAAGVSRATAYRYFPTQSSMIQSAVNEALGPILAWKSDSPSSEERTAELMAFAYPRIEEYEATHRAAVLLSLYQWTRSRAGEPDAEAPIVRGHRKKLLADAAAPLKPRLSRSAFDRLVQSLSLVFGTEAFIVLKDIWGLDGDESRRVAIWAANALVRAATAEAATTQRMAAIKGGKRRASANAPKKTR
jgi:AcrR family transcriptional regulator